MKTRTESTPEAPEKGGRRVVRRVLLVAGPLLVAVAALVFYLRGGRYVSSDNAFVRADKVTVTSEVSGTVVAVAVRENQRVEAGQLLFRIDDAPYRIALEAARAQRDVVRNELAALHGSYAEKTAAIDEAREQEAFARRELQRQEALSERKVSSAADLDAARHTFDNAQRHLAVLQQQAASVVASLGGDVNTPVENHPSFLAAQAAVDEAGRNLHLTVVAAPQAGIVTQVDNLPLGRFLGAGQPAFSLVAVDHVWVEANLKETDLTYLKPGDAVTVEIDSYPGRRWAGAVATISPATGAEFALIPPQNATGNWVKIVQRIPVRVELAVPGNGPALRAGMSVEVEIDTGHRRSLSDLSDQIAGWFGDETNA